MSGAAAYGSPLDVHVRRCGAAHVVTLRGAAGMEVAEQLRDRLVALVCPATPHLVIDMAGLTFISSIGISGVLAAVARSRDLDGVVRVARPGGAVGRVLGLMRLDQHVQVHATLEQAIGSLPGDPAQQAAVADPRPSGS